MLKFTNTEKTCALFNGMFITLESPQNWSSIGDSQVRQAVLDYLSEGNTADNYSVSQDELAIQALLELDNEAISVAKLDPVIIYLATHTPDECASYIQANVTSMATAIPILKKFAIALCVLVRDKLR